MRRATEVTPGRSQLVSQSLRDWRVPGSPQPAPGIPQAWHRPGFALSCPEPPAPGPAGSALPRVSWHRWAPGTRSVRTQDVRAPARAASGAAATVRAAQPSAWPAARALPPLSPRSERSGRRRAPGEGRRRPRYWSPPGPAESARGRGPGPAGFRGPGAGGSGAGRKRGGDTSDRRRRGEERGGRGGRAAAGLGRAHGARSLGSAAAASRPLPPRSPPRQSRA